MSLFGSIVKAVGGIFKGSGSTVVKETGGQSAGAVVTKSTKKTTGSKIGSFLGSAVGGVAYEIGQQSNAYSMNAEQQARFNAMSNQEKLIYMIRTNPQGVVEYLKAFPMQAYIMYANNPAIRKAIDNDVNSVTYKSYLEQGKKMSENPLNADSVKVILDNYLNRPSKGGDLFDDGAMGSGSSGSNQNTNTPTSKENESWLWLLLIGLGLGALYYKDKKKK